METFHLKWGRAFVYFHGFTIAAFALGGLIAPEAFWGALGIREIQPALFRIMGWYLLVFGLGGIFAGRDPERHAWPVLLMGFEKMAPAILLPTLTFYENGHWLLFATGVWDGVMGIVLIFYGRWLLKRQGQY